MHRNNEWNAKGVVWAEGIPYILLGKIKDGELGYRFYNIEMKLEHYVMVVQTGWYRKYLGLLEE